MIEAAMDPGALTARLELETATDEDDGQGGVQQTFVSTGRIWARIDPVATGSTELAGGRRAITTHRIWTGRRTDVTAGHRLRKGERVFVIRSVRDPDETGRFLVLDCEEERR